MILITGATGTVGSEVVKKLSAQGIQVRALTRDLHKAEANRLPHAQFVQGNFDDVDLMGRACSGVERAFLLTNSTERAEQQQIAFVKVARECGVRHIVKLSLRGRRHQVTTPAGLTSSTKEKPRSRLVVPAAMVIALCGFQTPRHVTSRHVGASDQPRPRTRYRPAIVLLTSCSVELTVA
jgi:NAD(P)-dependent dehydrogenase (short-subunit alcohol dehydrogenase family)